MYRVVETTSGQIASLAVSSETSSLALLNAIEQTVTTLSAVAQVFDASTRVLGEQRDYITASPLLVGQYIDPEDKAVEAVSRVTTSFCAAYQKLEEQRASVFEDARLQAHHSEALLDAYDMALAALSGMIDAWMEVRSAIITRDLAAEPRDDEGFASVDALLADLHGE